MLATPHHPLSPPPPPNKSRGAFTRRWKNECKCNRSLLHSPSLHITFFLKKRFYLFFREVKGGRKRRREISMSGCLSCTPYWGLRSQPRHVPWLGIEPVTLWFSGRHSIHWTIPARAVYNLFGWASISLSDLSSSRIRSTSVSSLLWYLPAWVVERQRHQSQIHVGSNLSSSSS